MDGFPMDGNPWMVSPQLGSPMDGAHYEWNPHRQIPVAGSPLDGSPWLGSLWMAVPGQALPSELGFVFSNCSCLAGIAGSVATLLHDAVMNPAEGNSWDAGINPSWLFSLCAWPGESRDKSLLPLSLGKNRKKFRAVPSSESSKTTKPRGLIPLSLGKRGRAARGN